MRVTITSQLTESQKAHLSRAVARKLDRHNAQEGALVPVAGSRTEYDYSGGEQTEDVDGYNNVHAALRRMMVVIGRTFEYSTSHVDLNYIVSRDGYRFAIDKDDTEGNTLYVQDGDGTLWRFYGGQYQYEDLDELVSLALEHRQDWKAVALRGV